MTQRHGAEAERDRADAARRQATTELEHAQAAERQAQANFDQARATVDQYLTTVSESQLLTIPGMQPLRQAMLDTARTFYERFVAERPQDPQLRAGLAAAYSRLGRVQSDLQRKDEGKEYYGKSQQLYEALLKEGQATPEVERGLAEVYFWQGRCSQTVLLCQRRVRQDAEDREAQLLLANTYNTLAVSDENDNNFEESLRLHRDAFRLRTALVTAEPTNPVYLGDLGARSTTWVCCWPGAARPAKRWLSISGVWTSPNGPSLRPATRCSTGGSWRPAAATSPGTSRSWDCLTKRSLPAGGWLRSGSSSRRITRCSRSCGPRSPTAYRDLADLQRRLGREAEAAQTVLQSRLLLENLPQETAE